MEKINIYDRRDFVQWLIIEAMSNTPGDFEKNFPGANADSLEVEMKVNGVSVPVKATLKSIEKQIDRFVTTKAKELIAEKFSDLELKINDVSRAIDESFGDFLVQE